MRIGRLLTGLVGLVALTMLLAGGIATESNEAYASEAYSGQEKGNKKCTDGIDNDVDGLIDGADPDCQGGDPKDDSYLLKFAASSAVTSEVDPDEPGLNEIIGSLVNGHLNSVVTPRVCVGSLVDTSHDGDPTSPHNVQPNDPCVDPFVGTGGDLDLRSMTWSPQETRSMHFRIQWRAKPRFKPVPWLTKKWDTRWVLRWEGIVERSDGLEVTRTEANKWVVTDRTDTVVRLLEDNTGRNNPNPDALHVLANVPIAFSLCLLGQSSDCE